MKFLLDTNVLIDLLNGQDYAKRLVTLLITKGPLYVSSITVAELRGGFTKKKAEFFLPQLYELTAVLGVDRKIAELGGQFRYEYKQSITDCLIAATAIVEKCQLLTRNKKDFPMPQLKFYKIENLL